MFRSWLGLSLIPFSTLLWLLSHLLLSSLRCGEVVVCRYYILSPPASRAGGLSDVKPSLHLLCGEGGGRCCRPTCGRGRQRGCVRAVVNGTTPSCVWIYHCFFSLPRGPGLEKGVYSVVGCGVAWSAALTAQAGCFRDRTTYITSQLTYLFLPNLALPYLYCRCCNVIHPLYLTLSTHHRELPPQ